MAAMTATGGGSGAPFPVRFEAEYPATLSKLTFVKWLLAIPHLIILYALNAVWQVISLIAFFAILFTRQYPEGLFKFNTGIMRWQANVYVYMELIRDEYPPFSFDAGAYPVKLDIDYPQELNRWAPLYKWILAIPHFIILWALGIAAFFAVIYAGIMVLVSGTYPEGVFKFVTGVQRWSLRATTYAFFMHDEYPPFSLD